MTTTKNSRPRRGRALLALTALIALTLTTLLACVPAGEGQESSRGGPATGQISLLEAIQERGVLRVGMSTFVPWAMRDARDELIGFEIDVARRLAEDMGVEIEFVPTQWSGIIPALLTGRFDMIIGGMGIRPARNLSVNFSIPYDHSGMAIAAHQELAAGFDTLEDFNDPQVVITARIGTTAADAAERTFPKAQHRFFDDESRAVQEILNGRAHALVASAPLPAFQVVENPDRLFLPIQGTFTREPIGFALPKGDVDILNFVNSWITVVEAEGWLAERKAYWFETRDWADQL
ncbi:amino acid ABC transporter substrate-binding protein [Alkalispirochaeta sphaeroplastigenens]|uniref:Amino acid ABC transporter substrate-binding protein n=1 Tax=Alkalispirochaeta sphaeroplastigenens TaxID=1187066 RepID=A0A2S4JX06_9SPIO|nr:transporter substrate-binding domain-containing protein [Alkalispirochaeta sphaeroplastigenens]POR04058.1 amino acid ABC transporter substrate-binding protein [Alkalispirochaeta sphaeroplastigenens]